MSQPQWKCIANLGDVNPIDYGGLLVFIDETGVYPPEMERIEPNEDNTVEIRRVVLDPCTYVNGVLSDNKYHPDSCAWFATTPERIKERPQDGKGLHDVCSCTGIEYDDLIALFVSDDPCKRAEAWRMVGDYRGWDNLDNYPLTLSRFETTNRLRRKDIAAVLNNG